MHNPYAAAPCVNLHDVWEEQKWIFTLRSQDCMRIAIHNPYESNAALDLFEDASNIAHYAAYERYSKENFIELVRRLYIVETRVARIIDQFTMNNQQTNEFVPQLLP
jgi:hypothetical protein